MLQRLIAFSLRQRLMVLLAVLVLAGFGLRAYLQLPIDAALRVEQRYFTHILQTTEAFSMIRSLFISLQELNSLNLQELLSGPGHGLMVRWWYLNGAQTGT